MGRRTFAVAAVILIAGAVPAAGGSADLEPPFATSSNVHYLAHTAGTENQKTRRRRPRRVAPDHQLEHAGDRHDRDQHFEPVFSRGAPDSGHALNVLQTPPRRLLPRSEVRLTITCSGPPAECGPGPLRDVFRRGTRYARATCNRSKRKRKV